MDSIKRLLISAFAAFALQASAQNISGTWNGELNAGIQKIPLVLNLTTNGKCTLDSPQQGAKGIPAAGCPMRGADGDGQRTTEPRRGTLRA